MTKFLLAVVLLAIGAKVFANSDILACKYNFSELVAEDEEGKKETGEQGKSKYDDEDKICPRSLATLLIERMLTSPKLTAFENVYFAFADRPNTPPPDTR